METCGYIRNVIFFCPKQIDQPEIHSLVDLYSSYMKGCQHLMDAQLIKPTEVLHLDHDSICVIETFISNIHITYIVENKYASQLNKLNYKMIETILNYYFPKQAKVN